MQGLDSLAVRLASYREARTPLPLPLHLPLPLSLIPT